MNEPTEFYRRFRPKTYKELVGQDELVKILEDKLRTKTVPHALLLTGNSGVGKTTTARILGNELGCGPNYIEINAAESRGIDTIREIGRTLHLAALGTNAKMYVIDECHRLTGDAQSSILKMLEDCPSHVYFVLCTTEPEGLLKTIKNRCTHLALKPLSQKQLNDLVISVCERIPKGTYGDNITLEESEEIARVSEGSARQALVILEKILPLKDRLEAIKSTKVEEKSEFIARLFMKKRPWKEITATLKQLKEDGEDPEKIRKAILGYASAVVLNGENDTAYLLLDVFDGNLYNSGFPGLVKRCYDVRVNLK